MYKRVLIILISFTYLFGYDATKLIKEFKPTQEEIKNGAVILKKSVDIKIDKKGNKTRKLYLLFAILNDEAARDYTQDMVMYNSFYTDKNVTSIKIIDKNLTVTTVNKDAIDYKSFKKLNSYDDTKAISFSLPALSKGKFVEYVIVSKTKKKLMDSLTDGFEFAYSWKVAANRMKARLDSVRDFSLKITIDNSKKLYYVLNKLDKPKVTKDKNSTTYIWRKQNLPKVITQPAPAKDYIEILPAIAYSTLNNWDSFGKKMYKEYSSAIVVDDKIKKLSKEITKDIKDDKKKIEAIYNYMQTNIKYVFAFLGRGGYYPHKANEVLSNLYGDCKDQAILFISLLKAVGIEANFALVNSQVDYIDRYKNAISEKYFNHVITYIPKYDIFINTTGFNNKFPGILSKLNNKNAFILKDNEFKFKKIKVDTNEVVDVNILLKNLDNQSKIIANVDIKFGNNLSAIYKYINMQIQDYPDKFEASVSHLYNGAVIKEFKLLNLSTPKKNVEAKFVLDFGKQNYNAKEQLYGSVLVNIYSMLGYIQTLQKPSNMPYGLKLNFALDVKVKNRINFGNRNVTTKFIQKPNSFITNVYKYDFNYKRGDKSIDIIEELKIRKVVLEPKEYKELYKQTQTLQRKVGWFLSSTVEDKKSNNKNDKQTIEELIDNSQYKKALILIKSKLKKEPKNAKLHYQYGVILGFIDKFKESEKEFQKAKELGYKE